MAPQIRGGNQAVRRNRDRFPDDFMFSLTREEIRNLSQIVISSGIKHAANVFAFTEQGVAMLSSVLNSKRAIEVNILIMRAFVRLVLSPHHSSLYFWTLVPRLTPYAPYDLRVMTLDMGLGTSMTKSDISRPDPKTPTPRPLF